MNNLVDRLGQVIKELGQIASELQSQNVPVPPVGSTAMGNTVNKIDSTPPETKVMPKHRPIPWGATVSPEFVLSVLWIEDQIGLKADALMACMKFESNLNPAARNPNSSGTGLIQFMRSTALRLGTTVEDLAKMDAVKQLTYVYKYFKEYKDRGFDLTKWTIEDTYMSILWPAGIGKDKNYHVFINDPQKLADAYDVNRGLDTNRDGFVTKPRSLCASR